MSENVTSKRKSDQMDPDTVIDLSETQCKQIKLGDETKPNLETDSTQIIDLTEHPSMGKDSNNEIKGSTQIIDNKLSTEIICVEQSTNVIDLVESPVSEVCKESIEVINIDKTVNEENKEVANIDEVETITQKTLENGVETNHYTVIDETAVENVKAVIEINDNEVAEAMSNNQMKATSSIRISFQDKHTAETYKTKFLSFISSLPELSVQKQTDLTLEIHHDASLRSPDRKQKKHSKAKRELFVLDVTPTTTSQNHLRYTTKFVVNTEDPEKVEKPSRNGCFNCGEKHNLKDCPRPKDHNKINVARQKHKVIRTNSNLRYTDEQKYGHLQPGKISRELRKALGLHENETPHYVYLMRRFGYPPGWLEEAKFVHSNLDMFDIDGKFVKNNTSMQSQGLDEAKIIDYPGFNVPLQRGFRDDYKTYRVPPFSSNFNKEAMVKFYEQQFAAQRDNLEACDMEIDADEATEPSRSSPSLVDLEQQKQQLLDALNDEKKEEELLAVKTTCFGTPLIKSSSPYSTLPNPDNFSKDISPLLNFENLPNTTGKYDQMTEILQKVRSTLRKEQT